MHRSTAPETACDTSAVLVMQNAKAAVAAAAFAHFMAFFVKFFIIITMLIILLCEKIYTTRCCKTQKICDRVVYSSIRSTGSDNVFEKAVGKARDLFYLNTDIHIEGNRELTIENCSRIEEYNEVFIRVIAGGMCIQICGCDLKAYDYCAKGLVIRGKISQVDLIERSGGGHERSAQGLREDQR